MAQQNFVQEGVDRVRETVESIEDDLGKARTRVRKQIQARTRVFEKQRKNFEKQAQKRVDRLRREINKNPYVKRAQDAWEDASKQVERGVDTVLGVLQVASKSDLQRIDRKLNQINKKLREIENAKRPKPVAKAPQASGSVAAS